MVKASIIRKVVVGSVWHIERRIRLRIEILGGGWLSDGVEFVVIISATIVVKAPIIMLIAILLPPFRFLAVVKLPGLVSIIVPGKTIVTALIDHITDHTGFGNGPRTSLGYHNLEFFWNLCIKLLKHHCLE